MKTKEESRIDYLVGRFLAWELPKTVCSDTCVSDPNYNPRYGTNLLTADEAKQMFEYLFNKPAEKK